MAGSRSKGKSKKGSKETRPSEHAKEAVSEWGKAVRLTGAALSPLVKRAAARMSPGKGDEGGQIGDAADALLSKMGRTGKVASKLGAGSRMVEKVRPGGNGASPNGNGSGGDLPVPIQESIEIAVPVRVAYALATGFEHFPEFLDRVEEVEIVDDDTVAFEAKIRAGHHPIEIEIDDRRPEQRIEWHGSEGPQHEGVVSFHELAPRLTHLELSVEIEPEGMVQRLTRTAHLTERAIRSELHRFKAYAELWQDEEDLDEPEASESSAPRDDREPDRDDEAEDEPDAEEEESDDEDDETVEAYEDEEDDDYEEDEPEDEDYEEDEPVEAYEDEEEEPEDRRSIEAYPNVEPAPTR